MVDLVGHDAVHGADLVPDACADVALEVVLGDGFDFLVGHVQVAGVQFYIFEWRAGEESVSTVEY